MTNTITRGDCLSCGQDAVLEQGKVLPRHLVDEEQRGAERFSDRWVCTGSGHPPIQGDEFDVTRMYAVTRHALARSSAARLRSELAQALAIKTAWEADRVIEHYATATVLNETLARFWRDLAAAKEPVYVVKDALAALHPATGGNPLEQAMAEAKASAARQFMTEVRPEIERAYPNGWTAEQVYAALFSI